MIIAIKIALIAISIISAMQHGAYAVTFIEQNKKDAISNGIIIMYLITLAVTVVSAFLAGYI